MQNQTINNTKDKTNRTSKKEEKTMNNQKYSKELRKKQEKTGKKLEKKGKNMAIFEGLKPYKPVISTNHISKIKIKGRNK